MKRTVIFIVLFFCLAGLVQAGCYSTETELIYKPIGGTHGGTPKAPARPWYISQDANVLTMSATPCAYTLVLCDEAGDVAYTAVLPAGTTMATLPATLSGDYEIRFVADTYYYYGYIHVGFDYIVV